MTNDPATRRTHANRQLRIQNLETRRVMTGIGLTVNTNSQSSEVAYAATGQVSSAAQRCLSGSVEGDRSQAVIVANHRVNHGDNYIRVYGSSEGRASVRHFSVSARSALNGVSRLNSNQPDVFVFGQYLSSLSANIDLGGRNLSELQLGDVHHVNGSVSLQQTTSNVNSLSSYRSSGNVTRMQKVDSGVSESGNRVTSYRLSGNFTIAGSRSLRHRYGIKSYSAVFEESGGEWSFVRASFYESASVPESTRAVSCSGTAMPQPVISLHDTQSFDGQSDVVDLDETLPTSGTISISFKAHRQSNGYLLGHYNHGLKGARVYLYIHGSDLYARLGTDAAKRVAIGVADDQWHHVVFKFGGRRHLESAQVYLDGQLTTEFPVPSGTLETTSELKIGAVTGVGPGTSQLHFSGQIKNVAIYDSFLSDSDILSLAGRESEAGQDEGTSVQLRSIQTDVNHDAVTSALDALLVINALSLATRGVEYTEESFVANHQSIYADVNSDGIISPIDALIIVNELSRSRGYSSGRAAEGAEHAWNAVTDQYMSQLDKEDSGDSLLSVGEIRLN